MAVLASHTAHRAVNKAIASNVISNFEREKEEVDANNARSKNVARAFSLVEQASEFLEAGLRLVSTLIVVLSLLVCLKIALLHRIYQSDISSSKN